MSKDITRRDTIRIFIGGGMLIAASPTSAALSNLDKQITINDLFDGGIGPMFILHPNNSVTLQAPIPDMGTGVETALPMVLAEELDIDWETVSVERFTPNQLPDPEGNMTQNYVHQGSGGSASVRTSWPQIRKCGIMTRKIILKTAAQKLGLKIDQLSTRKGYIVANDKSYPYADFLDDILMQNAGIIKQKFVGRYAKHDTPTYEIDLEGDFWEVKNKEDYSIIGKSKKSPRLDTLLTGKESFGIDHDIPGQLYASIERCPYIGGDISFFDSKKARSIKGVVDVVQIPSLSTDDRKLNSPGVAVIATSYWAAFKARKLLDIQWNKGNHTHENNKWHYDNSVQSFEKDDKRIYYSSGDTEAALANAEKTIESIYDAPHFAHLTMEPLNCVAWIKDDSCIFGAGCQYPYLVIQFVNNMFNIPIDNIDFLTCKIGGGFGRKAKTDYIVEAIYLSKITQKPVKVIWSREDDIQHDFFNDMSVARFRGGIDEKGNITAWESLYSSQAGPRMTAFPAQLIPNMTIAATRNDSKLPLGAWRGPGHNLAGFYMEGFLNELAELGNKDPYTLRMELLGEDRELPYSDWYPNKGDGGIHTSRNKVVLRKVAEMAKWKGGNPAQGKGRGIASHFTFGSFAAMVVDVSVNSQDGTFRIDRVTAAIDCGLVVNPSGARAQIEGGIIDGLSAAVHQNVIVNDGRVITENFNDIRMSRIDESPVEIDIHFVGEDSEPFGTGEIALPAFIPALVAALHDATGIQIRKLPIGNQLKTA
ncbi:xanthine dehydrogenase family protein molybdopterin-binding subunit [Kordiimonas sp. SCSIO 12610]|uniref:xanthine dehydrogenase family protein molybdopterin-binding subunit n=1 Tax=Kordiimonas sp. SCSIO 12610 TaxID=2829597 RepID=UPI00210F0723|nr:molybdopterin cofactor-binding domain-containing protein [Kordiimonas sp. SCSIO 12610]UTW54667.1 xanthine dehydrogenase family protein molybdopterin-binding subunit [Kordiimonas sp. SCSIO 12610]